MLRAAGSCTGWLALFSWLLVSFIERVGGAGEGAQWVGPFVCMHPAGSWTEEVAVVHAIPCLITTRLLMHNLALTHTHTLTHTRPHPHSHSPLTRNSYDALTHSQGRHRTDV